MAAKKDNRKDGNPQKPITNDPRFRNVHFDPRFVRPKKKDTKVAVDRRFSSMLKSNEFDDTEKIDINGRKQQKKKGNNELHGLYRLENEDDDQSNSDDDDKSLEDLERELEEDEENVLDESFDNTPVDYDPLRGKGGESSSDESSGEEEEVEDEAFQEEGPMIEEGQETTRLALVNMDWDHIKAVDILKVINGFKTPTSVIKSVTIYPTTFGKERLQQEDVDGPPREIFLSSTSKNDSESDEEEEEEEEVSEKSIIKNQLEEGSGEEFNQEALRKYQLERLRYYFAVIQCDSVETAIRLYNDCDGAEYESSANFFDLRFIPDSLELKDEPVDIATDAPDNYKPTNFSTEALQHTKVSLTWDQDDPSRFDVMRREYADDDINDNDFAAYLASSDDEDDDEVVEDIGTLRNKYRALLNLDQGKSSSATEKETEDTDMEITFTPGLSEAAEAAVQGKHHDKEDHEETTIEKYMRKQKERKQSKKERRSAAAEEAEASNEENNGSDHDEELESDPFFSEARKELEEEGFVKQASKRAVDSEEGKKTKKKRKLTKEERLEQQRQKSELELLVGDDAKGDGFDMKEVMKREKLAKKKGKKGKTARDEVEADEFNIDVNDPRFAAIHDSHHFAIDPTHPQFKKTSNMEKLLEARRSKSKSKHQ